jgi:tetratricopeptide (TPR) repeat protein
LGIAEIRTLNFAQAVGDLEASVPLLQDRKFKAEAGLELAGLYGQMGDLEKAAVLLDKLHKQLPDHTEILYASYRTYADLAGQSMLELSMTAPDSAQMHQIMAHEETRQGNTAGAIKQYRLAIAADPHLPGVHFELGELLSTSTDASLSAMAEEEYRTALAANPLDNKAERKLAEWHAKQGKFEAAKQEYERAVALQPNDADATLGLAEMLLDMDQANDALALFERTVQLEPTSATAHYQLGRLYWKKGRTEEAKQQTELYRKYKEMKDKLRTLYHEMRLHPGDLRAEDEERK